MSQSFRCLIPALLLLCGASSILYAEKPNVIVFLSDDQGWGDLSQSGNTDMQTPNIDSLATDGVSFDRFYVCPVCSPTRAEFLTGRHHARSRVYSTSAGGERMNLDETTVADLFKSAGYATAAFGKWHNGMQYPYHPQGRGFEQFYGFCSGHWGNYFDPMLERNGEIVKGEGFCIDDFTNQAMKFIEKSVNEKRPFFAYLPYNTPHSPMQVPERFWSRYSDRELPLANEKNGKKNTHLRAAWAMCENLDWNVGRVLKKLDELKIAKNTIVVWFHDNGPNGDRWNDGMKGRKGSTDEGGVRSPLLIRWLGKINPGSQIPHICTARDLLPTLCELADIPVKTEHPIDGRSLNPLIFADKTDWPERVLINHWKDKISARSQNFRLDHQGKLYDMINDPSQKVAVNKMYPEIAKKLSQHVQRHRDQFMKTYYQDERPFMIAHPEAKVTQLPARDAVITGALKRSNRFPNCSYFTNWVNENDQIKFSAEVAAAGKFKVVLYYAAKHPGSKYRIQFKDATLDFEILQVHDVPEQGAEHDRHPRRESYVKQFKPLAVGEIDLQQGAADFTIRAIDLVGKEGIEFRLLTLERLD